MQYAVYQSEWRRRRSALHLDRDARSSSASPSWGTRSTNGCSARRAGTPTRTGQLFYIMSGLHGLHVFIGLVAMVFLLGRMRGNMGATPVSSSLSSSRGRPAGAGPGAAPRTAVNSTAKGSGTGTLERRPNHTAAQTTSSAAINSGASWPGHDCLHVRPAKTPRSCRKAPKALARAVGGISGRPRLHYRATSERLTALLSVTPDCRSSTEWQIRERITPLRRDRCNGLRSRGKSLK